MQRKKLFFVLPVMKGGGVEAVASVLMNHVDRDRYALTLVLFNKEGEYLRRVPSDVEIVDLDKRGWLGFFTLIWKLRRLIRARKPDILLSSLYYPNIITVLARLLAGPGSKVVASEHNHHERLLRYKRFRRLVRRLMSFTYRRACMIVAVSGNIKNALVADFRIDPDRVRVIYNPMESDAVRELSAEEVAHPFFEAGEERFVVIGAGRLTRQKNFALLIRALARAREEIPACLLILGQGEMERPLRELAAKLGVAEFVDFVGFQHNPYKWMKRSDLFVLSSSWEGFGIVIVEAMLCGIPVISTDCPAGPSEIIADGRCGRLVPVEDAGALAAAIVAIARDGSLREKYVREGLANAARFDHSVIVPQYERLFEEILA